MSEHQKLKTLWNLESRTCDSREILDSNGGMLQGRIDIPDAQEVHTEGYDKVIWRMCFMDGSHVDFASWDILKEAFKLVDESTTSNSETTWFMPHDGRAYSDAGIYQLDVVKDWHDAPNPNDVDSVVSVLEVKSDDAFGLAAIHQSGAIQHVVFDGRDIDIALQNAQSFKYAVNRIDVLEAKVKKLESK